MPEFSAASRTSQCGTSDLMRVRQPSNLRCDLIEDREQPPEHFLPRNARDFHALRLAQAFADDAARLFTIALPTPLFILHLTAKEEEHALIEVRNGAHLRLDVRRQFDGDAHGFTEPRRAAAVNERKIP